jgi:urease beta subunit
MSGVPGEIHFADGPIAINRGRRTVTVRVRNGSRWPVQVSSHYHFFEANPRLEFDRARAWGMRLDIPAGAGVRWQPGETREVRLVEFGGRKEIWGFACLCDGPATPERLREGLARLEAAGFRNLPQDEAASSASESPHPHPLPRGEGDGGGSRPDPQRQQGQG